MASTIKQVYVSLYVTEEEIQLVAAEYYNTRFNIIKVERAPAKGIINYRVTDKDELVACITELVARASSSIGATIRKVILVLPAYNFKRIPLKVSVIPTHDYLDKKDVARAMSNALKVDVGDGSLVVNSTVIKYTINGISTRRMPDKEFCEEAILDIDLLCADKEMAYSYVDAIYSAGLEAIDITLDNFSICKEALFFEQSLDKNLILLDISDSKTSLSLLAKGKLVSTEMIGEGIDCIVNEVYRKYRLPKENIKRLIKYNVDFDSQFKDDAIFAWNDNGTASSLTVKDLNEAVSKPLEAYIGRISKLCSPITESGESRFVITGEGAPLSALVSELKRLTGVDTVSYFPDSIGVRDSRLCAVYGALFIFREKAVLNDLLISCVDMQEYDDTVDHQTIDVEGESLTAKIKNLFMQYKNKEDNK